MTAQEMPAATREEITMELLGDVATAVRHVLSDFLPSLEGVAITLYAEPKPTLVIRVDRAEAPLYPHIITGRVERWQLSNESRRRLGLPAREE